VNGITPAASVLVARAPGSREVLCILRGAQLRFFGGFWAFPGGKLAAEDHDPTIASPHQHLRARRIAACRELYEETGILVVRRRDGSFPEPSPDLDRCRQAVLDGSLAFPLMLAERELSVRDDDFDLIGEITTPAFAPIRYATTFFVSPMPPNQRVDIWPGELERGEWVAISEMLMRWRRGEVWLTPPSAMTLQALADHPVDAAPSQVGPILERLAGGAEHPIFFAPTVQMMPLKTVALAPGTHTNAYFIGSGPRYLLDPGADDPAEQARLFGVIDEQLQAGQTLTAIVLTHHHRDHIGAAAACAERYALPIWAHAVTAEKLNGQIPITRLLEDGERLDLGPCPADGGRWSLEAIHTPGHAAGHLAFLDSFYGLLFVGDMVSTLSSIVITPPDGDLTMYLQSLRRLHELPCRMLLPAHGNVSTKPEQVIEGALKHRAKRELQLLDTLAYGPAAIDELAERMYRGTPETLMGFARAQVLAGLRKLQAEARAHKLADERWQLG
jgi:ribonuclease/clavin/mitogillin